MLDVNTTEGLVIVLLFLFVIWYSLLTTKRTARWYFKYLRITIKKLLRR